MKPKVKPPEYGIPDEESPEVTTEEFRRMRPIGELMEMLDQKKPAVVRPKRHPRTARAA